MVRVLHLPSRTPDFQAEREAAALAQDCGKGFAITSRTIGRGGDYRNWFFAYLALRRTLAREFDVVHVWDPIILPALVMAGARNVIFSPPRFPGPDALGSVRPLMERANFHLTCSWEVERQAYIDCDLPAERCHLMRPGVDVSALKPGRDPALRAALGFAEQDVVFLAPGESTRPAGHRDALWAVGILHVLHPNWRMLLWGRGSEAEICARFTARLSQPNLLTIAERKLGRRVKFEELTSAADAVISAPPGPTPALPLAICMAAGLPIISQASPWTQELLKDGINAALGPPRSPRMLAQRAVEVMKDLELRAVIGAAARRDAIGLFPLDSVVDGYRKLYRKIGGDDFR